MAVIAARTAPSSWNAKPAAELLITPWRGMPTGCSGTYPLAGPSLIPMRV